MDREFTISLLDDQGDLTLLVCQIGGEARAYPVTDLQAANLSEQFASVAAKKLRKAIKCT